MLQTMERPALEEVVDCLVRVAWASAAGQLRLANSPLPAKEGTQFASGTGRRSRQSSTGQLGRAPIHLRRERVR